MAQASTCGGVGLGVKSQRGQLASLGDGECMQGNTRGEEWGAGVEEITFPWLPSPIPHTRLSLTG